MQQRFEQRAPLKRPIPIRYGNDKPPARSRERTEPVEKFWRIFNVLQNFGGDHEIEWLLFLENVNRRETNIYRKIDIARGLDRPDIGVSAQNLAITENICERQGKIGARSAANIEYARRAMGPYC